MVKSKHKNPLFSTFYFRLLMVITIVALSLLGTKNILQDYQSSNVLGETSYLASRGSDSSNSSAEDEIKEDNENEDNSEIEDEDAPEPTEVEDENEDEEDFEQIRNTSQFSLNSLKELQVRTEKNKTKIKLDSRGGSFELENEDGKLKVKIKDQDGMEFELENEALDDINEALEEEGIEVATSSGRGLRIRRGEFEAETHFPLSINPTTNQLTVTTPAGEKDVAVLPDQAVANLLRLKFIDRVASESAESISANIRLGLLGNVPVFQVQGVDDQKFLGILPVSIQKISFVSAENGEVVKIDETFLNKLLDLFSVQ